MFCFVNPYISRIQHNQLYTENREGRYQRRKKKKWDLLWKDFFLDRKMTAKEGEEGGEESISFFKKKSTTQKIKILVFFYFLNCQYLQSHIW